MSQFLDALFIDFSGAPITGRVPPRVTLHGDVPPEVITEAAHAYDAFRKQRGVSIIDTHIAEDFLSGGGFMAVHSHGDIDDIEIWAPNVVPKTLLPHGFAVRTNWARPQIYKRVRETPIRWALDKHAVPQATSVIQAESEVFTAVSGKRMNHPLVQLSSSIWDYKRSKGAPTSADAYPFSLAVDDDDDNYEKKPVHYARNGEIRDGANNVLFTMAATSAILSPTPEDPSYLYSGSSSDGRFVTLAHLRQALVAPTPAIYFMKLRSEKLKRKAPAEYERVAYSESGTLVLPFPVDVGTPVTIPALGEEITEKVWYFIMDLAGWGVGVDWGGGLSASVGWRTYEDPAVREGAYDTDYARRELLSQVAPNRVTSIDVLLLPNHNGADTVKVEHFLDYRTTMFWRGGFKRRKTDASYGDFPPGYYGVRMIDVDRRDLKFGVVGAPRCSLNLGWTTFFIFTGGVAGTFDGVRHTDIEYRTAGSNVDHYARQRTWVTPESAGAMQGDTAAEQQAWCAANDVRESTVMPIYAQFWGDPIATKVLMNKRPVNLIDYELTSRHIIDYDHKGRFYAAVEVTVKCEGAKWIEGGAYEGDMTVKLPHPTYTVTIKFISNWNGVTASQTLATATAERPMFEAVTYYKWNPYYYGTPYEIIYPVPVRMPPYISPGIEAMQQLRTLAKHQGFNDALAIEDVRPDITGAEAIASRSVAGIEFSQITPRIKPHTKYVTGQLYARTFKLSDFNDALWLLRATKCDATAGNSTLEGLPTWYYMPALGVTIATEKFHVELRDGVLTTWSSNIPKTGGGALPAVVDRDIRIHRV